MSKKSKLPIGECECCGEQKPLNRMEFTTNDFAVSPEHDISADELSRLLAPEIIWLCNTCTGIEEKTAQLTITKNRHIKRWLRRMKRSAKHPDSLDKVLEARTKLYEQTNWLARTWHSIRVRLISHKYGF